MSVKERFKTLVFAVSLLTIGLVGNFPPLLFEAEAGADKKIKVTNHIKYKDAGGSYCSNLATTVVSYEPVVYNGYGHYYNYHIMGNSGHTSHSYQIVSWVTIHTTFTVASCNT